VVVFDSGGVKEIVEHERTGLLAPYNDVNAFVIAMGRFIDERELISSMGKRGHLRAKEFFNRDIQMPLIGERILNAKRDSADFAKVSG
jgi:glycosyltransferase involved in cell wall biosynthesis